MITWCQPGRQEGSDNIPSLQVTKSATMALYLFKHSIWQYAPFQFVYKLIEVVEDKNVLLQNGDGFNGAAHALKDTIRGQIQCCILKYP